VKFPNDFEEEEEELEGEREDEEIEDSGKSRRAR
jgi:hypothetical protein